ncbi:MAG: transposase [Desulfobacteraceae bacterium]|jgi:REP element-mobilizing transposase RayT
MAGFRRKNIRLESSAYQNSAQIFSITICTWRRSPWLRNAAYAAVLIDTLQAGLFVEKSRRYAFCLMPDHLHLLMSPDGICLVDLISRWKSYTANFLRKEGLSSKCWQRGFYDHALRKEEEIKTTAEYIVHNPVRAGLVHHWREYAYSWHRWM